MFKKLNTQTNWILGSLTNEIGSEYTFGYDMASSKLLWLEHYGKKLSKEDELWDEAKTYIATVLSPSVASAPQPVAKMGTPPPESERPRTVQRSVVSRSYPTMDNESVMMGTVTPAENSGIEVEDDDIASRASEFLSGQLDAEELEYVNE